MQLGSMFISNCNITLHVSDAFCIHPWEHLKTVVADSNKGVQGRWLRHLVILCIGHTAKLHHVGSLYIYIYMIFFILINSSLLPQVV